MLKDEYKVNLTTGQISGLTLLSLASLHRYVKEFPEFFSSTAKQHKRGRRWTQSDLEMVVAIRNLYHEHAGSEKIRAKLAGGWRAQDDLAYKRELLSRLVEAAMTSAADSKKIVAEAQKLIKDNKFTATLTHDDHRELYTLKHQIGEIEVRIEKIERKLKYT